MISDKNNNIIILSQYTAFIIFGVAYFKPIYFFSKYDINDHIK